MNKTRLMPIIVVIAIGIVLGGLILTLDKPAVVTADAGAHADEKSAENQPGTGPRGGKLFSDNGFAVEVTIFEKGVPPQFRIYLSRIAVRQFAIVVGGRRFSVRSWSSHS